MPRIRSFVCLLLFSVALTACMSNRTMLEGVAIPVEAMNVEFQLYVPPEANTFLMSDNLAVVAENLANEPIDFTSDYGIRVFQLDGDRWVPIENAFGYPTGDNILLPKPDEFLGGALVVLRPALAEAQPTIVRVVLVGLLGDKEVAAFTDITLKPE